MTQARTRLWPPRVVGVGASAGGLEALKELLAQVEEGTGLAFIVLQHLPAPSTSRLADLLAGVTKLAVVTASHGTRVEPDQVVVVPAHTVATLVGGAMILQVAESGTRPTRPIDSLFESLATALGERAIGVVLSGTANDGTEGLRGIHAAGGITFAQDPATAQFDEMPRNAIASGSVQMVMSPASIGAELVALATLLSDDAYVEGRALSRPVLQRVLEQLRDASGVDFSSYKRSTIERRLARRLAEHNLPTLDAYSEYLEAHPAEASVVYEDLLIHVTEFFRDGRALEQLVARVFPELEREKAPDAPLRVWVPGCSTGEEVYSLGMLLVETFGESRHIQLFGSDLSERAVDAARTGRYRSHIAAQVSPERLARFFQREDDGYRISSSLRERCVFVRHDLVTDPPFSKLDLVSCRNVLIYLGPSLQKRVIPIFHYALNQPGYLLLGGAESAAGFEALFTTVDSVARIYARKATPRASLTFPITAHYTRMLRRPEALRSTIDIQRDVDHVLLARYSPACVVVDDNFDVVQFRGRTGPYLEQPAGHPQLSVLRMAREGLAVELPVALQHAQRNDAPVRREQIIVRDGASEHPINLEVVPLRAGDNKRHYLVVFEDVPVLVSAHASEPAPIPSHENVEVTRLRQELVATKEYLHSVVSQHVDTSEQLGIANEELQSANEELQSSNEELQTAKEELQSTNEELETLNEELQRGNDLLRVANDDLVNVLASTEIAIIIVDTEQRVRRFTPKARKVMKLLPGDIGRPIADLQPSVALPALEATITAVIETLEVVEDEVRDADGTWYRMQIRPYRKSDHRIGGAVLAFVDITALRAAREHASAIVKAVPNPLVVIDSRFRVTTVNHAFCAAFEIDQATAAGRELLDLGEWKAADLRERLTGVLATGKGFDDLELVYVGAIGERVLRLAAAVIPAVEGGERLLLVGLTDITERRRLEQTRAAAQLERESFLDAVSHELRTPLTAILLWAEALRKLATEDPRRELALESIIESAQAEMYLVDDLLDLAVSRVGGLPVKIQRIAAAPIVRASVESARADALSKAITIETAFEAGLAIDADPKRLRQITAGLLSNAIKFTPEGGRVHVSISYEDGALAIRVHDNGPGIPPSVMARIFEPFTQADQSSTRNHNGMGIGLALVRHLVERQRGTILVASAGPDQGTTFTVRFPIPS